jgi:hypothetical protein
MSSSKQKQHLFDNPRNVTRLLRGFYLVCAILLILDFVLHRHIAHSWENLPEFYAVFGFVACVLLVLIAKELRKLIMRKEEYYDVDE